MVSVYLFIFFFPSYSASFIPWYYNDSTSRRLGCFYILCYTKRRELVRVIRVRLGRFTLEQRHFQTFALGPPILEPKLHVLRLQSGKFLPIRHPVQLLRVFQNQLRIRIGYYKIISINEGNKIIKLFEFLLIIIFVRL